ncbi:Sensor protein TorS [Planctomycetes bacterium Poly30]|uniref:histidine kinase n=2 Tax=Saltatorellus ferox TaxID=2528018 RepID=A0A518F0G6_9BACT|nr:Sensor protein TorS [Planctomycetes bacterium Poly30]
MWALPGAAAIVATSLGASSAWVAASALLGGGVAGWIARRSRRDTPPIDIQRRALIAESTTLGVVMTDRNGVVEWANEGFARLSGYRPEELIGTKPGKVLQCEKSDPKTIQAIGQALRAGQSFSGEIWNRTKQGRDYIISIEIQPLHDHDGELLGFVALELDVTEQRQMENELGVSERRMRDLVEKTNLIVWEYEPEHDRFRYISPQAERLGFETQRWYEPGFFSEVIHEDDRERTLCACAEATKREEDHELTYRMRCKDGSIVWIRDMVRVTREASGSVLLRGVFIDITEQKETELELEAVSESARVEAERADLAFAGASIGLWDWRPQSDQLIVNACWAEMIGASLEELKGQTSDWLDRLHPEDAEMTRAALDDHFEGKVAIYEATFRARHRDGHWVWTRARGKVVERDEAGAPVRMVGIQMDETHVVERERELERLRLDAEAANRSKSEFLANMSHEIRTPLTAILGYADLLHDDGDISRAPERRVEMIETIRSAGQHLLTVINDILDLSKIEAERLTIDPVESDIVDLINGVASLARSQAEGKGVQLDIVLEGPIPCRARIDPTRVRQVMVNLLGNAAKFTEAGSIQLRVASPRLNSLRIEVEDTGPGIDRAGVDKLFQPFSQADGTVTRRFGGSGLGLSISRRLAELMGGSVTLLWTVLGEGSCFALEVPVEVAEGSATFESLEDAVSSAETKVKATPALNLEGSILLVEDGPVNQRLIGSILKRAGARVTIAGHGQEALDEISAASGRGEPFDVVLSDMQMPVMDGYTLARTLKTRLPELPVIALTAHAMAEDEQRCMDAGCVGYATKPIDREELLSICQRFMVASRQSRKAG